MESRTLTKTFSQILTNALLMQHGFPIPKSIISRYFISTCSLYNSDLLRLRKVRQPVLVDHCSPKLICSGFTSFTATSKGSGCILKNTLSPESLTLTSGKLFTHKVDIESIQYNGIGWAGQPIVKQIHPILPEEYGTMADIVNNDHYQKPNSSKDQMVMVATSELKTTGSDIPLTIESVEKEHNEVVLPSEELGELKTDSKKYSDSIYDKITRGQEFLTNNIVKIHNAFQSSKINHKIYNNTSATDIQKDKELFTKEDLNAKENIVFKKTKLKKRRKTKVCESKTDVNGTLKRPKKRGKPKEYILGKKHKIESSPVLHQRTSTHAISNKVLRLENRQFNTGAIVYNPRVSKFTDTSRRLSVLTKDNKKISEKRTINSESKIFDEDCTCPEIYVVKSKRRKTKICGNAAGAVEEKKETKAWKPKMCLLEQNTKYRNRTFVCASKVHEKDKKKRQLPKCVKPEKMTAPRVQICSPNLIDELEEKSKKKCTKLVEEVKVRKSTKVCKPVLLYATEISEVNVEKATCVTVKKEKSRHTKICPPQNENDKESNKLHVIN